MSRSSMTPSRSFTRSAASRSRWTSAASLPPGRADMTVHPLTSEQKDALLGDRKSASGGGFPLPEALRAVLAFLHDNGEAGESVLHRVIREQHHVEFKEKR